MYGFGGLGEVEVEIWSDVTIAGRTNDEQKGKIELLSQWTMEGWDEQFPSNVENIKWSSSAKFSTIRNMPKKNLQIAFVKCICEFAMVVFLLTIPPPNRWRSEFENVLRFLFWSEVFTSTASSLFVFLRFSTSLLCLQWRCFFFTSSRFAIILIARKTKNLSLKIKGVAHGWTRGFSFPGVSWPWLCAGAHVDR